MKKKFTMLFAALLAFVGVAKAGVTDLPQMSTEGDIKWYTIKNVRRQKFATYAGDNATMTQQTNASAASFFYFTASTTEGAVKIHNYAAGDKLCAAYNSWTAAGIDWYLAVKSAGVSICTSAGEWDAWNDARGEGQLVEYWSASDAGSAWEISLVTDFSAIIDVSAAKEAAKTELDNLAKISALFSDATQAKTDVDAVKADGTGLAELNAAVEAINAIVVAYKKQINGKNVRFTTYGRNTTDGHDMTAVAAGGAGATNSADAGIWTLMSNNDGTFKMYNFVSNLYLMSTRGQSQRVLTCESFADAASYTFNVNNENTVNLLNNGNTLHMDGSSNIVQWNDNSAGASIWKVVSCAPIVVSREQYDAAAAAKTSLPYAVQQAYGLVTDANQYYSNYKSTAEGSYEALLDNQESSFFHSAYGDEPGDGSGVHYIQADLGEGNSVDEFYFYMKPRSGNGNNRPKNVTVYGSNDNVEFTKIAEVTTTLDGSMTPYVSEKLGAEGKNYRYIRLTVTSTNTGTKFFTLSELYFFPADGDAGSLMESYHAFASSSITSDAMSAAATSLINAEATLALANIKKEVSALLTANASNHAATPALGQYTTEAYNALQTAYDATDATQESLEAAIAAFEASFNVPVYFITSEMGEGTYAGGKAILYNGSAWRFDVADIYNRQMWMTIPGYTEENVPTVDSYSAEGATYEICDYLTGTVMRGKKVQIVKIENWDGVYNLQYGTATNDAVQHAQNGGALVGWNPATTTDCKASAWSVEYIGNSYDLDKLTDAHVTALSGLQAAYNTKAFYADAVLGEGLGQYQGTEDAKAAIVATLAPAEAILNGTLTEQANATVDAINAAAAAINEVAALEINLPETGKFYRFQGACEASLPGYYITGHTNADGGRIALTKDADASTIYYFDGTNLTAYQSGLVVGLNSGHWTFASIGDDTKPASTITFAGSPRQAGKYTIKSADRYFHYTVYNNTVQVNRCQDDACKEHDWNITEVTTLPVSVSVAEYATLYAPVALTIADGVTAYTATIAEDGKTLNLNKVEGTIPAKTGVILEAAANTYNFAVAADVDAIADNALVGSFAKSAKNAEAKVYTLQMPNKEDKESVGFYLFKGQDAEGKTTYINGFRAWIEVAEGEEAPAMFSFGRGQGTTSIENALINTENAVIYDLAGRRVEKMEKGIYIVNGRKVVVK